MTTDERLWKTFNKALGQYQLIDEGDRILVGLSGGKDSLLLLEFLARRQKILKPHFTVEALHVRMENIHYETDTTYLQSFCNTHDVPLHIVTTSFEEKTGESRDESGEARDESGESRDERREWRVERRESRDESQGSRDERLAQPNSALCTQHSALKESSAFKDNSALCTQHSALKERSALKDNSALCTQHSALKDNSALCTQHSALKVNSALKKKPACFLCSWQRRKQLFNLAQELHCTKIALGHHQDDIIHTALLNLTFQGHFSTMPAKLKMRKMPLTIIRPLCLCHEDDIRQYAEQHHYEKQLKQCPYEHDTNRTTIHELFRHMERLNPEARYTIWRALEADNKLVEY